MCKLHINYSSLDNIKYELREKSWSSYFLYSYEMIYLKIRIRKENKWKRQIILLSGVLKNLLCRKRQIHRVSKKSGPHSGPGINLYFLKFTLHSAGAFSGSSKSTLSFWDRSIFWQQKEHGLNCSGQAFL